MTTKTVSIITDSDKLNAAILEVSKRANSLVDSIQLVLASAVYQAVMHGNTNHINATVTASGRGVRKTAIAQWLLKHAPVVPETDKEKMKTSPFRFSREKLNDLLVEADLQAEQGKVSAEEAEAYGTKVLAINWADHKEPPLVPESWSVTDALQKLLTTAKQMQSKKVNVKGADLLGQLQALMPSKDAEPAGL